MQNQSELTFENGSSNINKFGILSLSKRFIISIAKFLIEETRNVLDYTSLKHQPINLEKLISKKEGKLHKKWGLSFSIHFL